MIELYDLHVFVTAAETQNFSEAGRILQISQPAVSGHIQSLEQRLNAQLFDRMGRNIRLNEVGESLVPIARNLLKEAQNIEQFMALQQGAVLGQLVIGCSTAAGKYVLPRVLSRFLDSHPDVRTVCQVGKRGQALDRLTAGEIDLAISSLRIPRDHPWAHAGAIEVSELIDYPIIMREATSGTAITINRALSAHDLSIEMLRSNLVLENTESIVHAVCADIGPAFVSSVAAGDALAKCDAVEVQVNGLHMIQHLYMARHTGFHASEAQKAFWEFTFAPENRDLLVFVS